MTVLVEQPTEGPFTRRLVVPAGGAGPSLSEELADAIHGRVGSLQLWIHDVNAASDAVAVRLGFVAYRDLWQLRCSLPLDGTPLPTVAYTDNDMAEMIQLNNRAFDWHPEQGSLTVEGVRATMGESWFDREGFRLYRENRQLVGFCWTKVHTDHEPALGEIYVIAIDPDHHGKGLGKPMTMAGLGWLADKGLTVGMLYVESDNNPANATYASIGFRHHRTDRCYRIDLARRTSA